MKEKHRPKAPADGTASVPEVAAIRRLLAEESPALVRAGDAVGYAALYTPDALWMPPGEHDRRGQAAIAEALEEQLLTARLEPAVTVRELALLGDQAWAVGREDLSILPADGSPEGVVTHTVVWVLKKLGGRWKIARQIWKETPGEE